ncbi:MAG: thiamine pyrophosphate-binding protein [Gammaproteobacteria bacterium]|nr:thiamine pyrophosphate-binding protein [Gammaproteobacteria bacterium]
MRTLAKAGVKHVFALHGAHLETLFQSAGPSGISITDTRHEAAAGHAAEGYARAARKLGVAMITAGPGFTNVITSIANAYLDRTPVLYLAGSAALRDAQTNTLQAGIDQVAIARPICKWAHQVTVPQQLARLTAQAIRLATSGPTGPVLLDLPMDVLTATVDDAEVSIPGSITVESPPAPFPAAIHSAIEILSRASHPVIMAGAGAWQSDAGPELLKFAEATGIPVYSDFQAHGLLPSDHRLYGGTFHKMADLSAPGDRPDAVLALGVRFGLFTLGGSDVLVPRNAKLIHVEIDPKEIGLLRDVDVPIVADCRETLIALNEFAASHQWPDRRQWQKTIQDAKSARARQFEEILARTGTPIHPYQAVSTVVEQLPEETIVIGDGAESYHWLNEVIRQKQAGGYITHGFLGAVGFGLGLAIGAQLAHRDRRVLCLAGDGAVGFTIAEFDTMARHGLPIVVVIMNNRSWAASQHFQEMVSGCDRLVATRLGNAQYHEIAAGFGCHASLVTEIADLGTAIQTAFASRRPACVNVVIDVAPIPPEIGLLMRRP